MNLIFFISTLNFEEVIRVIAISLVSFSQFNYLYRLFKRGIQPSLITWIGWAVLLGISFIAQFSGWNVNTIGLLISTLGCCSIAVCAFLLGHYSTQKSDHKILLCGLGCIFLYMISSNAWLTTLFAIASDFIFAIPTIKNAYQQPEKSRVIYWPMASISWIFNVWMISYEFKWLHVMWPAYLVLFNGIMTYLTYLRRPLKKLDTI